jgi:hypothetical protein
MLQWGQYPSFPPHMPRWPSNNHKLSCKVEYLIRSVAILLAHIITQVQVQVSRHYGSPTAQKKKHCSLPKLPPQAPCVSLFVDPLLVEARVSPWGGPGGWISFLLFILQNLYYTMPLWEHPHPFSLNLTSSNSVSSFEDSSNWKRATLTLQMCPSNS